MPDRDYGRSKIMWQSRVEIEHYSVKGGAHTRWVNSSILATFTRRVWAPPLTEVLRYSASNTAMRSKYATE